MADRSCKPERHKAGVTEYILKGHPSWSNVKQLLSFNPATDAHFCWRPRQEHAMVDFVFGKDIHDGFSLLNASSYFVCANPGETSPTAEQEHMLPDHHERNITVSFGERFEKPLERVAIRMLEGHFPQLLRLHKLLLKMLVEDAQHTRKTSSKPMVSYIALLGILDYVIPKPDDIKQYPEMGLLNYRMISLPLEWAIRDYVKLEKDAPPEHMQRLIQKLRMACVPTLFTRNGVLRKLYSILPADDPKQTFSVYKDLGSVEKSDIRSLENELIRCMSHTRRMPVMGGLHLAFDYEVGRIVSEHITHVRNLRKQTELVEPVVQRLYEAGRTYLFRNNPPGLKDDPPYLVKHEYEATFAVDMKDFTSIFDAEDVLSAAIFVHDKYLQKINQIFNEVKVPTDTRQHMRWANLVNIIGDAYITNGDIFSMLLMAIRSMGVIQEYKKEMGKNSWLGMDSSKLDGGCAIAWRKQSIEMRLDRVPGENVRSVILGEGINLVSRLCGRDQDVRAKAVQYRKLGIAKTRSFGEGRVYPFSVYVFDSRLYNVGIVLEEEAVTALLMNGQYVYRMNEKTPRELSLTHTIDTDKLHEEILRRYVLFPDEQYLQFTIVRPKELIAGKRRTLLLRFVGPVRVKGVDQLINIYELIYPDEDPNSFYSLYMKHHGDAEFKKIMPYLS